MTSLKVSNVPREVGDGHLRQLFSRFGRVVRIVVVCDFQRADRPTYAFVDMDSEEAARTAAAALRDELIEGVRLRIEPCATPQRGGRA